MAEHDGDDMHDWETFNQQIEKLLLSMQKTDRAAVASPRKTMGLEYSLPRSVGYQQRPSFASILEHANLRQNLSESAFEQAAEIGLVHNAPTSEDGMKGAASLPPTTGPQIDSSFLAQDLQPLESEVTTPANVQPTTSSPEKQSPDEELPCSGSAKTHESAEAQMHICHTSPGTRSCVAASDVDTALERDMQSPGDAEQASIGPARDLLWGGSTGMQGETRLGDNPYRLLLQQIDLHIATCQASLASIYPEEQSHRSAQPTTPAPTDSAQAKLSVNTQRSVYRNALYESLPESLDSPCGIVGTASKREAMAAAPQLFAEELDELMAAEAAHAQPAMPIASPSFPTEHPGRASPPAESPPFAEVAEVIADGDAQRKLAAADRPSSGHVADCSVEPRASTVAQQGALAEQHAPQDRAPELDAGPGGEQAMQTACLPAEGTSAGQHAHGSERGEPVEASSHVMEQEETPPQACSAAQEPATAASGSAEPPGAAHLALRTAMSGGREALEALDEVEQEHPQLIGAWWPPVQAEPDLATSLPGPGSGEPMHTPLDTPSAWLPQRDVSVEIRDAERRAGSRGQQGASAASEREQDTGSSPCRILRLSMSPPCSGYREDPAGETRTNTPTQSIPAEVRGGLDKENSSPELQGCAHAQAQLQDPDASQRGAMQALQVQDLCGAVASILQGRDLQASQGDTTTELLEVYQDLVRQDGRDPDHWLEHATLEPPCEGLDTADERAHQAGVARQCLEIRLGAHAAELAERDTHVAYLSSAMGLAENLLTAKQRKVEELSGESLGLQDVLSEAGAEAATKAVRLTELEANMKHQQVQLVQAQKRLAEREQQLAQCLADLADAQRQLAAAQAPSPSPFASASSLLSRTTSGTDKPREAYEPKPLLASTPLPGATLRPTLFTPPRALQAAASPMSAVSVRGMHSGVPGSSRRAQRSAWEAMTPPLSHGRRTTEALTVVLKRIRSREEAV